MNPTPPVLDPIEKGLRSVDKEERWRFASSLKFTPTPVQIERGLKDWYWKVRLGFARRTDIRLTPEQIERGLNDTNDQVRLELAKRPDYTPTPQQIQRGLEDPCRYVAEAFVERASGAQPVQKTFALAGLVPKPTATQSQIQSAPSKPRFR